MSEPSAKSRPMIDLEEFERRLRRPLPQQRDDADPLAELARLVNGEADPYHEVFADQPGHGIRAHDPSVHDPRAYDPHAVEPAWEPVAEPAWEPVEETPGELRRSPAIDFAAIEAGLLRGTVQPEMQYPESHYAAEPTLEPQLAGFHTARYPDPPGAWEAAGPEASPRSRKPLYMMAAVILLGIGGIGASFAYKGRLAGPQQIATIMAAPGPTKVQPPQPDDAGAMPSASVLDKSASQAAVALADHREEPVDVTQIKADAQAQALSPTDAPAAPTGRAQPGATPVAPPAARPGPAAPPSLAQIQEPMGIAALIEPKKVRTVSVRPDGTLLPNDAPPQSEASLPVAAAPARPVAKPSTPKTATHVATPPSKPATAERAAADAPLSLTPPAKARPTSPRPIHVADATPTERLPRAAEASGDFAVQLAAPGSEKEARETSSRLEHQFASQLDGHQPSIRKAKVGDKDVYRVRVSGLSREDAAGICQKIQAGGGKCFIARN